MDSTLQKMYEQNESHLFSNDCVVIRPNAVISKLNGKLSEQDLLKTSEIMEKQIRFSSLIFKLNTACTEVNCNNASKCMFRSIPVGNIDADVMFVSKTPTEYETLIGASHTDVNGAFLSLILGKLNTPRGRIYMTDFIKCNTNRLDEDSYNLCINNYFAKEVEIVKPKLIICTGLSLLMAFVRSGIFDNLPEAVSYGNIYNASTKSGHPVKIMSIYDLDKVLQKTGDDYEKCKTELWCQLLTGFKSI